LKNKITFAISWWLINLFLISYSTNERFSCIRTQVVYMLLDTVGIIGDE